MVNSARQLLHVDLISLAPATGPEARDGLLTAIAGLREVEGVEGAGVIEGMPGSDADLLAFFILPDLPAIEAFGTDPRYTSFLQEKLAPSLLGLSGADVELQSPVPAPFAQAACLIARARDTTYDWQIKDDLAVWAASVGGQSAVGVAAGERQRYRGLAIAFTDSLPQPLPAAPLDYGALIVAGPARRFR